MKRILLALALFLIPVAASAQCNGVFQPGTACGNNTAAPKPPTQVPLNSLVNPPGGTNGQVQYNNAGAFGGLSDSQLTARIQPFTLTLPGSVPAPGSPATGKILTDSGWSTTSGACQTGWFCVSNYATPALAVAALNAAGGGTLYFDTSVTVSSALTITVPADVRCASRATQVLTSSTTANLFNINGSSNSISSCTLGYSGTTGTKTAGIILNSAGFGTSSIFNLTFTNGCFVCIQTDDIVTINDVFFTGNLAGVLPNLSTPLQIRNSAVAHLSNITLGASATGSFYNYGINIVGSAVGAAVDAVNLEIITAKYNIQLSPTAGNVVYLKLSTSYIDNCLNSCINAQTSGGIIGYLHISDAELGLSNTSGFPLNVDTVSGGGNIGSVKLSNSSIFNYSAGGFCANFSGSLGEIILTGNGIGQGCAVGFNVNGSTSGGFSVMNNAFYGSTLAVSLSSVLPNSLIMYNRLNGHGIALGGNSATNVANNLP